MLSRKHAVRQVGDGWRNADAAACEHWRPGRSATTDTVVRGRSDTRELDQFTTELDRDVNDDAALTRLGTSHEVSLGEDDRDRVLLHRRRLLVLAQHYVVLDDVAEIDVRKLSPQQNTSRCHTHDVVAGNTARTEQLASFSWSLN